MKPEKFKVIECIRDFIIATDLQLDNFPKKELELKKGIKFTGYHMLRCAYKANSIEFDIQQKLNLAQDIIADVKLIDFLLNICSDRNLIPQKKYLKLAKKVDDIIKYTTGWVKALIYAKNKSSQTSENNSNIKSQNTKDNLKKVEIIMPTS